MGFTTYWYKPHSMYDLWCEQVARAELISIKMILEPHTTQPRMYDIWRDIVAKWGQPKYHHRHTVEVCSGIATRASTRGIDTQWNLKYRRYGCNIGTYARFALSALQNMRLHVSIYYLFSFSLYKPKKKRLTHYRRYIDIADTSYYIGHRRHRYRLVARGSVKWQSVSSEANMLYSV